MKKYLLSIAVVLAVLGIGVAHAAALKDATVSILPSTQTVSVGKDFAIAVSINPGTDRVYSSTIEIRYPTDLLELKSFAYNRDAIPLTQSGYDVENKVDGVIIKTAGFSGGATSPVLIGTASFSPKKVGVANIAIGGGSMILNGNNENVYNGSGIEGVIAIVPVPATASRTSSATVVRRPSPTVARSATVALPNSGSAVTATTSTTTLGTGGAEDIFDTNSLTGSAGDAGNRLGFGGRWAGFIIGLIILAILIAIVYSISSRRRL
jgi:hypothetical protein